MNTTKPCPGRIKKAAILGISGLASSLLLANCGNDKTPVFTPAPGAPGAVPTSSEIGLGNIGFDCPGQSGQQQQQQRKSVPYHPQQQQQQSCTQQFKFVESRITDLDVRLDCAQRVVTVKNKGANSKNGVFPIQSDGTVKGSLEYQQQIQSDQRGAEVCWVEYRANFDGKAQCGDQNSNHGQPGSVPSGAPGTAPSGTPYTTPSGTPYATPSGMPSGAPMEQVQSLSLTTQLDILGTDAVKLSEAGILGAAGPSPLPSPSASPSVSPTPIVFPLPSGLPLPLPSTSPEPVISPRPTGIPVRVCAVQNPCSIISKADLSCQ